jgi:hypothetical protein
MAVEPLRSRFPLIAIAVVLMPPIVSSVTFAADPPAANDPKAIAFFEAKIRPVLAENCYKCHSTKSGKSEGGLLLDTQKTTRAGGDRGPAVVPGDPGKSLLLTAISHSDPDLQMPPRKGKLPEAVINDIKTWIKSGAVDPRTDEAAIVPRAHVDIQAGRQFWSLKKPVAPKLPATKAAAGWAKRDLDQFILAKLETASLAPSPDAEPATLLRRLHFDLVGLPPAPDAADRFLKRIKADGLDAALAAEVDRLLASPQFGERWGRHWLDVARYAESSGKEANISFPYAWRYRDYVIDAVNADVPYDRFILEQVAGDLLPSDTDAERARLLIATGFLAVGPKNLDEGNQKQFEANLIDEQIDALTLAVTASSVACARCHDHKFDPFAMEDYYALAGVFASTKTYFGTHVSPANRVGGDPLVLPRGAGEPIFDENVTPAQVAKLKADLVALKATKIVTLTDALRVFWASGGIKGQLDKFDDMGQALPLAMGVAERERMINAPLLERGEVGKPGKSVPRGFPRVVEIVNAEAIPPEHCGRLELAKWLTSPDHPLTARVMVNRVWRQLFGAGIVRTMDNFGTSGERPSHPELLDHLAVRFVADGWSVKRLVREMVLSRTYRQSSTYRADAFRTDPGNRLLWRAAKRRLDAEAIRDAMLAAAGDLDLARPGGSIVNRVIGDGPISLIGLNPKLPTDLDGTLTRSVYLPVLRDHLPDVLDLFDFAEPSLVTGDRETTNVPVQALYLMNSPFVLARSQALADRVTRETNDNGQRIRRAFSLCFTRLPDAVEEKAAAAFLERGQKLAGANDKQSRQLFAAYCQALLAAAEFRNID